MTEDVYLRTLKKVSVKIDGETFEIVAASFRGVPFFVENYNQGGLGRSVATKKIPFSDKFVNEDIGANIPTHSMNLFIVGDDCDDQKNKLIEACSKEGAADFIHPWLGKFKARISQLSFSSSKAELGLVKGSITVVQEDESAIKGVSTSMKFKTKLNADSFRNATKSKFVEAFEKLKKVKGVLDSAVKMTENALDVISDARKTLNEVNEFVNEIGKLKANIKVILQTPGDFAARIENLLTTTATIFGYDINKKDEADEFIDIMGMNDNSEVGRLVKKMSAASLASSLVDASFVSVDEASQYQKKVVDAFDSMMNDTDDIDDYMSLNSLQASSLEYLRETMENMAIVIDKEVKSTTNILTFAFDTYNDVDRVDEIMNRNGFSQGLFVTPQKVKVLSK